MTRQIALLRGINVGGANKLPMKELTALLHDIGCKNVRTYIQSGNVVFEGKARGAEITTALQERFGFSPQCFVLSAAALCKAAANCPFSAQAEADPKSVHLYLLENAPDKGAGEAFNAVKTPPEAFAFAKGVMYLHSPKGLSASKIADKADRILKTKTTARNWNTICALIELAGKA